MQQQLKLNIQTAIINKNLQLINEYLEKIPIFAQFKQNFQDYQQNKKYNLQQTLRRLSSNRLMNDLQNISVTQRSMNKDQCINQTTNRDFSPSDDNQYIMRSYTSCPYYKFLNNIKVISLINDPYQLKKQALYVFIGKGNIMSKRLFMDYNYTNYNYHGISYNNQSIINNKSNISTFGNNFFSTENTNNFNNKSNNNNPFSKISDLNLNNIKYKRFSGNLMTQQLKFKDLQRNNSSTASPTVTTANAKFYITTAEDESIENQNKKYNNDIQKHTISPRKKKQDQIMQTGSLANQSQNGSIMVRSILRKGTSGKGKNKTNSNHNNKQASKDSTQLKSFQVIDQYSFYSSTNSSSLMNQIKGRNTFANVLNPNNIVVPTGNEQSLLLQISTSSVNQSMMNFLRQKYNQKIKFLMGLNLFDNISKLKIQSQSHHFKFTRYKFNQILYAQDYKRRQVLDENNSNSPSFVQCSHNNDLNEDGKNLTVYFIEKGQVQITVQYSMSLTSKKSSYIIKGPNIIIQNQLDRINQSEQLKNCNKIQTVKCITQKCIAYIIKKQKLEQIIRSCFKYQNISINNNNKDNQQNNKTIFKNINTGFKNNQHYINFNVGNINSPRIKQSSKSNIINTSSNNIINSLQISDQKIQNNNKQQVIVKNKNLQQLNTLTNIRNHYYSKTTEIMQGYFQNAQKFLEKIKNQDTHQKYRRVHKIKFPYNFSNISSINFYKSTSQQKNLKIKNTQSISNNNSLSKKAFKVKEHFSNSLNQKYGMFANKKINFLINKKNNNINLSPTIKKREDKNQKISKDNDIIVQCQTLNNSRAVSSLNKQNYYYAQSFLRQKQRQPTKYSQNQGIYKNHSQQQQKADLNQLIQHSTTPILYQIKQLHPSEPQMSKINAKLRQARLGKIQKIKQNLINSKQTLIMDAYHKYQQYYQNSLHQQNQKQNRNKNKTSQGQNYDEKNILIDKTIKGHVQKYLMKKFWRKKGQAGNVLVSFLNNNELKIEKTQIDRNSLQSIYVGYAQIAKEFQNTQKNHVKLR